MRVRNCLFSRSMAVVASVTVIVFSTAGLLAADAAATDLKIRPLEAAGLEPGLAVLYFYRFKARHLEKLPSGKQALFDGKPGRPIPYLNHAFGKKPVFDSGTSKEIGMQMSGYLKLAAIGTYGFKAYANDGIRVWIDGHLVVDDPAWHAKGDRYSEPLRIDISKAGWHPMRVRYFQRKGTATIKMYWKNPGDKAFAIIPAEAYAHDPAGVKKK